MPDYVEIEAMRAALAVADLSDYDRAAIELGITPLKVRSLISDLERRLELTLFTDRSGVLTLSENARWLIGAFRQAISHSDME